MRFSAPGTETKVVTMANPHPDPLPNLGEGRRRVVSSTEMKAIDTELTQKYSMPSLLLMENAGRGVAEEVKRLFERVPQDQISPASVVVLCGTGNNGGDGLVAARQLAKDGVPVHVVLAREESAISGDAKTNLNIVKSLRLPLEVFNLGQLNTVNALCRKSVILIDALLGTGTSGSLREPYATLVRLINESGKPVVAVDIPSGLDPDTGIAGDPTVKAATTVTMGLPKNGLVKKEAAPYVGRLLVADLGIPILSAIGQGGTTW